MNMNKFFNSILNKISIFAIAFTVLCFNLSIAVADSQKKIIQPIDGRTLIYLGSEYLTNVAKESKTWVQTDKESMVNRILAKLSGDQLDKVSTSVVKGIENIGKMLVLFGAAKEYWDLFHYKDKDSKSPYGAKFKEYSQKFKDKAQSKIDSFRALRLELLQNKLIKLAEELNGSGMNVLWLSDLFDSQASGTISESSLKGLLSSIGLALSPFYIYNVGIDHVGDDPYGAMLAKAIPKIPIFSKLIEGVSYSVSGGALFYTKGAENSDTSDYELKGASMKEGDLKWSSPQVSLTGLKSVKQVSSFIRLNLFVSPEPLDGFELMMLNSQSVYAADLKGNLASTLGEGVKKVFGNFSKLFDKSGHLDFLRESVIFGIAFMESDDPVPTLALRFAIGEFSQELSKGESLDGLSVSGQSGTLRVEMYEDPAR